MIEDGVAVHSQARPDPPVHILQRQENDWRTWCGGGLAHRGMNTLTRRRCRPCTALLREGVAEGMYDEDELQQWLRSTR